MKKNLILSIVALTLLALGFGMQDANYKFMILNEDAATETALFSQAQEGIIDFETITNLNFQSQQAVYKTEGKIKDNYIADYHFTLIFNGAQTTIACSIDENVIDYSIGDKKGQIKSEKPLLIIENNVTWMWQLVYNLYKINGNTKINVFVPQLLIRDFSEILPLEIQKETELDGYINVFFDYNGQSGMIRANAQGQVEKMLISGILLERIK